MIFNKGIEGFTLIELLIVIAIIAILMAVIFVALNPLKRFQDSRDSARWMDVRAILDAIIIDQVDNKGFYVDVVSNLSAGKVYMVGTAASGCDDKNAYCLSNVSGDGYCVNLQPLVDEYYLGELPVAPNGQAIWSTSLSGYTVERISNFNIRVRACESEGGLGEIFVTH